MVRHRTIVTFDGHDLTECFRVGNLQRPLVPREAEYVAVPGADGALFVGATDATRTVRMTLTVRSKDPECRARAMRQLAAWLHVDEPKGLSISEDGGLWYKAMPNASADGNRYLNAESFDIEFTCDSCMYGLEREEALAVAALSPATFTVGGTLPTPCRLTGTVTAAGQWTLSLDGSAQYTGEQDDEGSDLTLHYDIDAETRVARFASSSLGPWSTFALSPTDTWFWLAPGEHTITATGCTASLALAYTERWA